MRYEEKMQRMKDYLLLKFEEGDWHGVMDAAADLRDIESEEKGWLRMLRVGREQRTGDEPI